MDMHCVLTTTQHMSLTLPRQAGTAADRNWPPHRLAAEYMHLNKQTHKQLDVSTGTSKIQQPVHTHKTTTKNQRRRPAPKKN